MSYKSRNISLIQLRIYYLKKKITGDQYNYAICIS